MKTPAIDKWMTGAVIAAALKSEALNRIAAGAPVALMNQARERSRLPFNELSEKERAEVLAYVDRSPNAREYRELLR